MTDWIKNTCKEPDTAFSNGATERQSQLTKPPGSLGQLETISIRLAALFGVQSPNISHQHISVFAADHGIVEAGISAFPQEVTAEMVKNFSRGGAAISVLANQLGAHLEVINLGTVGHIDQGLDYVVDNVIAKSTHNFIDQAAMSHDQLKAALNSGKAAADRAAKNKNTVFIGGDMGIGNTTSSAALYCALLNISPKQACGPGTGLDDKGVIHKAQVVTQALAFHADKKGPLELLRCLGGFEIAALCGSYLRCAQLGIPIIVDGYITTAAALLAWKIQPQVLAWMFFSHRSAEPAHQLALKAMSATPILDLGLRLGEGSGAALCIPIMQSACALQNNMATFAEAAVSQQNGE
jgi:nicotinate-nucleotide--dimethylbenzimidazole phosphoribosyltransferase